MFQETILHKSQNIEPVEIEEIVNDPVSYLEENNQRQAQISQETLPIKRSSPGKAKEKPTLKKKKLEHLANAVKDLRQVTEYLERDVTNTNEHDAFGNFVAASLKVLPIATALLAQHEIQSVLMNHRLSVMSSETTWTPTSSGSYTINSSRPSLAANLLYINKPDINEEVILDYDQNSASEAEDNIN